MNASVPSDATGGWIHPRARRRWFWIVLAIGSAMIGVSVAYARLHYRIGFSPEEEQSVGSAWSLVTLAPDAVSVGHYAAFHTDARVRLFPTGTLFVKWIAGGPGDVVRVGALRTTVNGVVVAGPLDSAARLHIPVRLLERTFILGPGQYFAVGTRPHSYDSRYWGPVYSGQFIGPARLL